MFDLCAPRIRKRLLDAGIASIESNFDGFALEKDGKRHLISRVDVERLAVSDDYVGIEKLIDVAIASLQ